MKEETLLRAAIAYLKKQGEDADFQHVLSHRLYEDRLVFVVRSGQKYTVSRAILEGWQLARQRELESEELKPINATSAAIAYANQHGIDVRQVEGTGQGGRIILQDVRKEGPR